VLTLTVADHVNHKHNVTTDVTTTPL